VAVNRVKNILKNVKMVQIFFNDGPIFSRIVKKNSVAKFFIFSILKFKGEGGQPNNDRFPKLNTRD